MSIRNGGCGIIQRIAEESGLSISSVYKILSSRSSFSADKCELVRGLAKKYGYSPREGMNQSQDLRKLTIGILIPKYPAYFWDKAIEGMKNAAQSMTRVKLSFCYYSYMGNNEDAHHAIELLLSIKCDAYIIYPIETVEWASVVPEIVERGRVLFFNDMMEDRPYDPRIAYIGPDHYEEGASAAYIAAKKIAYMNDIVVLISGHGSAQFVFRHRIRGFEDTVKKINPNINIRKIVLNLGNKMAAAELAKKISREYSLKNLDCIYVSSGFMYVACMAVEKLNRIKGSPCIKTICIGQEHSPSDDKYLKDGRIYAYITQDVYLQGYMAVKEIVSSIMMNMPLKNIYLPSTPVFAGNDNAEETEE